MRYESYMPSAHRKPGHIICQLAQEKGATSVTMGQRGLGTISRALLGSTSGHVLHHSHIPVMIVPSLVMKKKQQVIQRKVYAFFSLFFQNHFVGFDLKIQKRQGFKCTSYMKYKVLFNSFMLEAVIIQKPNQPGANQWTGFYMITASVMKRLKQKILIFILTIRVQFCSFKFLNFYGILIFGDNLKCLESRIIFMIN